MGDIRNANPDQLEELARLLWTEDDGGAYGMIVSILDRARNLDVSAELAALQPLREWLVDAASQLRDGARILRDTDEYRDPIPGYVAPEENSGGDEEWVFEVPNQFHADEFVDIANKDELTENDISRLQGLIAVADDQPAFAGYLIDTLGMADFLRLSQEVESFAADTDDDAAQEDATALLDSMGSVLAASMFVPGDMAPGSGDYQDWVTNNPEGMRYLERLDAFNAAGAEQMGGDDDRQSGFGVAVDLLERSDVAVDGQFFDQTMDHLSAPFDGAGDHAAPWSQGLSDRLMMLGCRTNPEAVDARLGFSTEQERVAWATDLMGKGEEMTDLELAQLTAVLEANEENEEFAVDVATELGAEGTLQLWTDLAGSQPADGSGGRGDALAGLQEALGGMLGRATRSEDPAMDRWTDSMIELGDERLVMNDTLGPYGFQVMSALMYDGEFGSDFLQEYGDAMTTAERVNGVEMWSLGVPRLNFTDTGPGVDPASGFMTALSRQPTAATEFFNSYTSSDDPDLETVQNVDYFMAERDAGDVQGALGDPSGIDAIGLALSAGATGFDPHIVTEVPPPAEPDPDQERLFTHIMEAGAGMGNDFPEELRDDAAFILASYPNAVYGASMRPLGQDSLITSDQLAIMATQVARDPEAYGTLSLAMNAEYVQRISNDTTPDPEYRLQDVAWSIGFLEEARYAALEIDGGGSSWYGSDTYNLISYGINKLPYGAEAMFLIDTAASAWTESHNGAILDEMQQARGAYFSNENEYLEELSNQWSQSHSLPDEERADGVTERDWEDRIDQTMVSAAQDGGLNARERLEAAGLVSDKEE